MNQSIREIEQLIAEYDELGQEADTLMKQLEFAEISGADEVCQICKMKWSVLRAARRHLTEKLEQIIMYRLPPRTRTH